MSDSSPNWGVHGDAKSIWQLRARLGDIDHIPRTLRNSDIVIVGGGITGLSTALHLGLLGIDQGVCLLEQGRIGHGATGRSGGILVAADESVPGSEAECHYLYERLSDLDALHLCQAAPEGTAPMPHEYYNDVIDPMLLVSTIAAAVRRCGIRLFEGVRVSEWEAERGGVSLSIGGQMLRAKSCVLAVGANIDGESLQAMGLELYSESCVAVRTHATRVPWTYYKPIGGGDYVWGRICDQSAFLFGGGSRYSSSATTPASEAEALLVAGCREQLALPISEVTACWRGQLTTFRDGRGWRIREEQSSERLLYAGGYDDYGIPAGFRAGAILAKRVAGYASRRSR